ncbi:MAG: hypothetical protein JWN66_2385 [Sphingomonas bacterium]|uniref:DUF983 domain-containing protein n=1 Tax=Sphingomonas bacterium TaxID=1895847 RepID=UPI00261015CE|nr:DUF983 domain-containing protein [Sphingomonas bacterium]MDB5705269.1 hypothetical protein [Sphingomonas bacterium]
MSSLERAVEPTPAQVALKGLCPRCGAKTLFAGMTKFADRCAACGFDLTMFNVGDGPAAFLTLIVGGMLVGVAVTLQLTIEPPLWLLALILIPLAVIGVIGSLRIAKGALLALEYRNSAREGRIADK